MIIKEIRNFSDLLFFFMARDSQQQIVFPKIIALFKSNYTNAYLHSNTVGSSANLCSCRFTCQTEGSFTVV